ncbi:MAG TPA: hypothetical protein VJ939_05560 [Bacteroidales bacterium]|nr:hypothetical protein [Bacteroidales bacterium]
MARLRRELSRTLVYREVCSEGSQPAKVCTDPGTLRYGAGGQVLQD